MPTRNRSTTESGRGETDEVGLVADTDSACITQLFHLEMLRAREPGKTAPPHIGVPANGMGAVRCPERSCAVDRMVSEPGVGESMGMETRAWGILGAVALLLGVAIVLLSGP